MFILYLIRTAFEISFFTVNKLAKDFIGNVDGNLTSSLRIIKDYVFVNGFMDVNILVITIINIY